MTDKAPTTDPLREALTDALPLDTPDGVAAMTLRNLEANGWTLTRAEAIASVIQRVEELPDLEVGYHPQLRQGYRRGINAVRAILRGDSR